MARKKVPLKDKAIIKKRLAQGKSQREAIKGTVVKSHTTAGLLAKHQSTDIDQLRGDYIILIEQFDAGDIDRAELWAEMTRATKTISAQVLVKEKSGVLKKEDEGVIEVPDWANREKALKYIDTLKGISGEGKVVQTQVNIFTRLGKEAGEFIEGEEVGD